ncbi:hypothetical protein B0T21DRAFT_363048 [Apiosordaria backusii]|uniref:RING-type domain-containing protein n=1 Tax=Apiosordaria backusii TaxID=314023 RepID=A0AA40BSQ2_9PEZI|nr:hypothetical protein B0T21DRAFT_363048 [Apiosordaria backusii]
MPPSPVPPVQIVTSTPWTWPNLASLVRQTSPLLLPLFFLLTTFRYPNTMGKKGALNDRKGGPTIIESEKQIDTTDPESSCPICTDPIGTKNPEGAVEGWSELPCGHRFGSHCIKHYLGIVADDRPACPICRQVAHHQCGHPVVPMLCGGTASKPRKPVMQSKITIKDLGWKVCGYCETARGGQRKVVKNSLWRLPFRTIANALNPRRRREMRRQQPLFPSYRPPRWVPPAAMRDPGWEKWWKAQAPAEV